MFAGQLTVFQESWVQILRPMTGRIETSHQKDHVYDQEPIFFDTVASFHEPGFHGLCKSLPLLVSGRERCFSLGFHDQKSIRLGEPDPICYNEHRWTGCEPEEGSPALGRGGHELLRAAHSVSKYHVPLPRTTKGAVIMRVD